MSTIAFRMPNEGHIGGFDIRRFVKKYMTIGLAISVGIHATVVGTYLLVLYISSLSRPPMSRTITLTTSTFAPPPSLSESEIAPALNLALPKLAPPAMAIPKPVAEEIETDDSQIMTQEQLKKTIDAIAETSAVADMENIDINVEIPQEDEIPDASVFTPFEQAPQVVKRVQPNYPPIAQSAAVGGQVIVQFYVDKNGDVKKAKAIKATPPGLGFEEAAVDAIMQWKFTPALQREHPVGVWVAQTIKFEIKNK